MSQSNPPTLQDRNSTTLVSIAMGTTRDRLVASLDPSTLWLVLSPVVSQPWPTSLERSTQRQVQSMPSSLSQRPRPQRTRPPTSRYYHTSITPRPHPLQPLLSLLSRRHPDNSTSLEKLPTEEVGQQLCHAYEGTAARPVQLPAMTSTVRASSGGGTTSTRSPHLYSQLSRSSSPDGQQDDGDEDEKGSTFGGGGYEYARRPPRTKRLLRLFLSTASVSFLGLLVLLALLPPRSRPKPLLEVLTTFTGEDAHVYTTRREYCSPLILERNDEASMETTRWDPLEREYWATSITGGDLLDREYPPRVVDGMVKIVHQSWKTHVVPARFKAWSETWREYNGEKDGWMHVIWSDEDNARLVREHYG